MTTDKLMVPRWKVIADFPGNTFYIGEIFEIPLDCKLQQIVLQGDNYESVDLDINPQFYPAIFKKLEWWEDRQDKDLPKYIKKIYSGTVYKVEWNKYKNPPKCIFIWYSRLGLTVDLSGQDQDLSLLKVYEPATEQEYLNQNNG